MKYSIVLVPQFLNDRKPGISIMMEKNGSLLITEDEKSQILSGSIPDRITRMWGLSLAELTAIIQSGQYQVMKFDADILKP